MARKRKYARGGKVEKFADGEDVKFKPVRASGVDATTWPKSAPPAANPTPATLDNSWRASAPAAPKTIDPPAAPPSITDRPAALPGATMQNSPTSVAGLRERGQTGMSYPALPDVSGMAGPADFAARGALKVAAGGAARVGDAVANTVAGAIGYRRPNETALSDYWNSGAQQDFNRAGAILDQRAANRQGIMDAVGGFMGWEKSAPAAAQSPTAATRPTATAGPQQAAPQQTPAQALVQQASQSQPQSQPQNRPQGGGIGAIPAGPTDHIAALQARMEQNPEKYRSAGTPEYMNAMRETMNWAMAVINNPGATAATKQAAGASLAAIFGAAPSADAKVRTTGMDNAAQAGLRASISGQNNAQARHLDAQTQLQVPAQADNLDATAALNRAKAGAIPSEINLANAQSARYLADAANAPAQGANWMSQANLHNAQANALPTTQRVDVLSKLAQANASAINSGNTALAQSTQGISNAQTKDYWRHLALQQNPSLANDPVALDMFAGQLMGGAERRAMGGEIGSFAPPRYSQGFQQYMDGGEVEGFAAGNAIPPGMQVSIPQAPQLNPHMYGQYVQQMMLAGIPMAKILPPEQFAAMQSAPVPPMQGYGMQQGMPQTMGFARGQQVPGPAIPVAGHELVGPGTGTSDSIPAVIDGHRPAALSTGEFVMTNAATEAVGSPVLSAIMKGLEQQDPAVVGGLMTLAAKASAPKAQPRA